MTDQTPLTPEIVSAILRDPDSPLYPTQITVFCDHCGTEHTGDYMVSEDMTSEQRLAVARKHLVDSEGWEHTDDGDDFCPEHAGSPAEEQPAEVVALEAAGCRTWRVAEDTISRVDDELDRLDVFAKGYWQDVDGKLAVVGLRVGTGEARVVARYGDWLVRHPDGSFTVHAASAVVETGE